VLLKTVAAALVCETSAAATRATGPASGWTSRKW